MQIVMAYEKLLSYFNRQTAHSPLYTFTRIAYLGVFLGDFVKSVSNIQYYVINYE